MRQRTIRARAIFRLLLIPLACATVSAQPQPSRTASANSYLERGNGWMKQGELERAITDYDLAVATDPRLALAYLNRGIARQAVRDLDGALADFNRALALNSNDAASHFGNVARRNHFTLDTFNWLTILYHFVPSRE